MTLAQRLGLALGVTQTLAWATTYYIPATMVGAASREFGVTPSVLLGGFTAALLVAGVCSPLVGRRIERVGGRGVMAASTPVTALGLAGLAATPNLAGWYAAWMVIGVGMAMGLYDASFATIGRLLGTGARPAIVGVTLLGGFASSIGWPTGVWLVGQFGWRAAVASYAVLHLAVILPVTWFCVPRAGPAVVAPKVAHDVPAGPPPRAFHLMAAYFTLRAAITAVISVHALTILAGLGATAAQAVTAAAMIGPAQVGARLLDWRFARGLSPLAAGLVGAVLLPAGFAALLGGFPALVFAGLYGMSNGLLTITRGTLPLHVFGAAGYATRIGRIALPSMIAQAAAPTLLAPLVVAWPAWDMAALLAGAGLVALACLALLLPLRA